MAQTKMKKQGMRKLILLAISVLIYVIFSQITPPQGIDQTGLKAIALMIIAIIFWVGEIIPIGVSSVVLMVVPEVLGIGKMNDMFSNFMIGTIVFIFAAFLIAQALTRSGLGTRISLLVSSMFGNKPDQVLLSFMLPTALISSVLLDIPTALIFGGLAYSLLQKNELEPGKSNFGRSMMVGIPVASAIGGIATPAGSGLNVLSINLLESTTGISINFLQWTMIGLPMAVVLVFVSWFVIKTMYKAEIAEVQGLENIKQELKDLGGLSSSEKKFISIFTVTLILWFTSPITGISAVVVAIVTAAIFFLPGIDLNSWDKAERGVSWSSLFLLGCANSLAMLLVSTGATTWLGDTFLGGLTNSGFMVLLFAVSAFGVFSHLLIPVGGAVLAVAIPIVAVIGTQAGVNPAYLVLPIAFTASDVFLLPLDPIPLTTYNYGYWTMPDMIKPGFIISLVWIVLNVVFMYAAQILHIVG